MKTKSYYVARYRMKSILPPLRPGTNFGCMRTSAAEIRDHTAASLKARARRLIHMTAVPAELITAHPAALLGVIRRLPGRIRAAGV